VLGRAVGPEVARFYSDCHRAAGVDLHCGASVRAFVGDERVAAIETADGRRFACDVAIIGIGVVPNVELAAAAGLACENGIVVDELARTADVNVVAAGDCTNHTINGRRVRLESVPNAVHQARVAAGTLLGAPAPYSEVPWFWSDQYDLKLQIVGLSHGYDQVGASRRSICAAASYWRSTRSTARASSRTRRNSWLHGRKSRRRCCATRAWTLLRSRGEARYCCATCCSGRCTNSSPTAAAEFCAGLNAVTS